MMKSGLTLKLIVSGLLLELLCSSITPDPLMAACAGSSPNWASTPDLTSVRTCVSNAVAGDTISISGGSATWAGGLTVNKNISLVGAGVGSTIITANTGTLVTYSPLDNAALFRVSGFTFDMGGSNQAIVLNNNQLNPPVYQVRIDHNRFTNSTKVGGAIENYGTHGVVDHNTFDNMRGPNRAWGTNGSAGTIEWNNYPELLMGAANDNLYYEDNTFSLTGSLYMASDCDQGGRFVYRYNRFTASGDMYPWLDWHGGRSSLRSCFAGEIYGNIFDRGGFLTSWRGGRASVFLNSLSSGSGTVNIYNNDGCPTETKERHNNGYIWGNRQGVSGALIGWSSSGGDVCGDVVQNKTFWIDDSSNGVRKGTLAAMPATCTVGQGYWATDQSTTNITGMVGPSPSSPIKGSLYKCTSTNIWTSFYTPLQYPHPLTTITAKSIATIPPSSPQNLRVQ